MLAVNPNLSNTDVRKILRRTSVGQGGTNFIITKDGEEERRTTWCVNARAAVEQAHKHPSFPIDRFPTKTFVTTSTGDVPVVGTGTKEKVNIGDKNSCTNSSKLANLWYKNRWQTHYSTWSSSKLCHNKSSSRCCWCSRNI